MITPFPLKQYLRDQRSYVDSILDDMLPSASSEPSILHNAMRHCMFAGGKRIRPILAIMAGEMVGGDRQDLKHLCAAIECIHTYSLVHDDLPAMDNDDFRRGKPTVHKVFGEAVAVLTGDALLTHAFMLLSSPESCRISRLEDLTACISDLAMASGSGKLIAGQVLDILSENIPANTELVYDIMSCKTAALIKASITCGARLCGADRKTLNSLAVYGELIGQVFQIRDDLLDVEGDAAQMGKAVNKDGDKGKATLVGILGINGTVEVMHQMVHQAEKTLEPFSNALPLISLAEYIGSRTN